MTSYAYICRLLLIIVTLCAGGSAVAQNVAVTTPVLHVVKSNINDEAENGELCLEFDAALAPTSSARLASVLRLEADGKLVTPTHVEVTGTSLCLFPLERGAAYHLKLSGLRGANDEKLAAPYSLAFTVQDRSPVLSFTGKDGDINGFSTYDSALTLRAVNVAHAKMEVYRVTDIPTLAHIWQDKAQTNVAPTESVYMARNKGQKIWQGDNEFNGTPNSTVEQKISLRQKFPDLASGLYLIASDAGSDDNNKHEKATPADTGLAPLAAAWFVKSDFSIRAVRDVAGVHVFAAKAGNAAGGAKADIHLIALNKKFESVAEVQGGADGVSLLPYPKNYADVNDVVSVIGVDAAGNIGFADISPLPQPAAQPVVDRAHTVASHLELAASHQISPDDNFWPLTIKSLSSSGASLPLVGGRIFLAWEKLDPAVFGWKNYIFGMPTAILDSPVPVADFLTDLQGATQLRLAKPKPPQERGLYQAVLTVVAEPDSGVAEAQPLIVSMRPEMTEIGIKPLAIHARFAQNGIARFALIGLSSDGMARDVSGLSYQIYEEGRSFAWYQDGGRWKYKPEPTLRPIGGGALVIKADASSTLEWPVTAGNYRLEIHDQSGKPLAQTEFSAGWNATSMASDSIAPLNIALPKTTSVGHEVVAHVMLPEASMLTAIIADTRIRKIVHEFRPKGDNTLSFTPSADWQKDLSLSVNTTSQEGQQREGRVVVDTANKVSTIDDSSASVSVVPVEIPSALVLRKKDSATLAFTLVNQRSAAETYNYAFSASAGLAIENGGSGTVTLAGNQKRTVTLTVAGEQIGNKELKLEVTGANVPRNTYTWPVAVLSKTNELRSQASISIEARQPFVLTSPTNTAFVSRRPLDGLPEMLASVFAAHPYTTSELAVSIDALRLWGETLASSGFAPDFLAAAHRQELIAQLLRHQNADGGFSSERDGDSTIEDTSSALTALAPDMSQQIKPEKQQAIGWLKQQLANTWFSERERAPRASAYAALAASDAIDPASLHYFSDTSAPLPLPAVAEAQIAAAFKHMRDPNAAAFWIKKMLDEHPTEKSPALLNALAATDALPSDDVLAALKGMKDTMPTIEAAADILRAVAADTVNAGAWKLVKEQDTRSFSGVTVLHPGDWVAYHNGDDKALFVTPATESESVPFVDSGITRHIYRMNGVELLPQAKPARGEIYMIQLKGAMPETTGAEQRLVQDGTLALRPVGCPLSAKLDTLAFMPWFTTRGLTSVEACEFSSHEMNVILAPSEADTFTLVYFARIDADSVADIQPPRLRLVRE